MEQNKLSIAVIIPAYNVAPYIEEAIQSVLEQPYPYITIVCVNDGSTDNTQSILLELSSKSGGDALSVLINKTVACRQPEIPVLSMC